MTGPFRQPRRGGSALSEIAKPKQSHLPDSPDNYRLQIPYSRYLFAKEEWGIHTDDDCQCRLGIVTKPSIGVTKASPLFKKSQLTKEGML